jgi:hypothetical protein
MSDVAGETTLVGETGKGDFQVEVRAGTPPFRRINSFKRGV